MEILIIIVIVVLVIHIMITLSRISSDDRQADTDLQGNQELTGTTNYESSDMLINNPYYTQYRTVFDLIMYNERQPKYKIDWLIESLDRSRDLEDQGMYVVRSMEEDLPYFCETEREYDMFHDNKKPVLKGSMQGFLDMAFLYKWDQMYEHQNKYQYWIDRVEQLAYDGNKEAQAAICSNYGKSIFPQSLIDYYEQAYRDILLKEAEQGDADAQLAVGEWLCGGDYPAAIVWLTRAARHGLTDAYFHLAQTLNLDFFVRANNSPDWNSDEGRKIKKQMAECYLCAAECNNGIMASYCQSYVASNLEDGYNGFEEDKGKSLYWLKKAAENGDSYAKSHLEYLQRN